MRTLAAALLMAVLILVSPRTAAALGVGDPAPKLAVSAFVKGDAVTEFSPGKVYVVEFWATWCGPCRVSIPHLSELAKKHTDVAFIGVDVWEPDTAKVKPFVAEMGDKMAYRVALDTVADGAKPETGAMAQTWMQAANQNGIPAAFVVNGDGKIAWIGHPMTLEQPLAQIVAGKWDLAKAIADQKEAAARNARYLDFRTKLKAAGTDVTAQLAVWHDFLAADPAAERQFGLAYWTLLSQHNQTEGVAYGDHLVGLLKDDAMALNGIAWTLVDPARKVAPSPAEIQLGLRAAARANALTQRRNPEILDTLAAALYRSGEFGQALACQKQAVALATDAKLKADMQTRVELYAGAVGPATEAVGERSQGRAHLR